MFFEYLVTLMRAVNSKVFILFYIEHILYPISEDVSSLFSQSSDETRAFIIEQIDNLASISTARN